jgi:hypothetical protein
MGALDGMDVATGRTLTVGGLRAADRAALN